MDILSWARRTGKTTYCIERLEKQEKDKPIIYLTPTETMAKIVKLRLKNPQLRDSVFSASSRKWWSYSDVDTIIDNAGYIDQNVLNDVLRTQNVVLMTVTRSFNKDQVFTNPVLEQCFTNPVLEQCMKHGFYHKTIYDASHIPERDKKIWEKDTSDSVFKQEFLAQLIDDSYTWRRFKALYCKGVSPNR